ncbi:hypothetical protein CDAR_369931 [Caerostris darwini]|uniref:Uncharacterized protein n=1 Tax=Caerostris darwini TaxID=1538125 RepID=A0AAV4Q281_9ARAC|nr:hypothetical protein CDAR_369931 [Caerostris darwini]
MTQRRRTGPIEARSLSCKGKSRVITRMPEICHRILYRPHQELVCGQAASCFLIDDESECVFASASTKKVKIISNKIQRIFKRSPPCSIRKEVYTARSYLIRRREKKPSANVSPAQMYNSFPHCDKKQPRCYLIMGKERKKRAIHTHIWRVLKLKRNGQELGKDTYSNPSEAHFTLSASFLYLPLHTLLQEF